MSPGLATSLCLEIQAVDHTCNHRSCQAEENCCESGAPVSTFSHLHPSPMKTDPSRGNYAGRVHTRVFVCANSKNISLICKCRMLKRATLTKAFYHFLSEGFSEFICPLPQVNLCQQPPPTRAQSMLGLLRPQASTLGFDSLLLV